MIKRRHFLSESQNRPPHASSGSPALVQACVCLPCSGHGLIFRRFVPVVPFFSTFLLALALTVIRSTEQWATSERMLTLGSSNNLSSSDVTNRRIRFVSSQGVLPRRSTGGLMSGPYYLLANHRLHVSMNFVTIPSCGSHEKYGKPLPSVRRP